jgi:23S rRNA G2069 N7-methylase RlmK/C1962 C5-methylase RlmI
MLGDRIAKNARHLRKWARRQGFGCIRLYNHDIPEYPLSLDDYEGRVLVTLSEGASWNNELEVELRSLLACSEIVVKSRGRHQGQLQPERAFAVQERGMKFEVNLHGYQDTGLFLDHRLTRTWVRERSQNAEVLNLFCYTGSFSVAAALGGARRVTSLDLSHTYLDWAGRNFVLNELPHRPHLFVQADVLQWLPQALDAQQRYDLIVCDPPTFSNSKRMKQTFDLQKVHLALLKGLQRLLSGDGQLLFSCNDTRFRLDPELPMKEITSQTRSPDFQRGGGHRCWQLST